VYSYCISAKPIMSVTASDWAKGIGYSVAASIIGGASKLAIRKSWLMVKRTTRNVNAVQNVIEIPNRDQAEHEHSRNLNHYESPTRLMEKGASNSNSNSNSNTSDDDKDKDECDGNNNNIQQHDSSSGTGNAAFEIAEGEESFSTPTPTPTVLNHTTHITASNLALAPKEVKRWALVLRFSGMIGMTFLNPLFCVLAMNYASPSILAPFSGLTLVWIVLFSETMIGEKPSRKQVTAACLIVLGEVIVAVFGDHTNDEGVTVDDVIKSYQSHTFQFYFFLMFLWIASLACIMIKRPTPTLKRFAWGVSGGSITGFQNFLKDSLTITKACSESGESYPWQFYIFALMAIASSFTGLIFLTACMKRYDATFSSAMFVGSFVISASIMSSVHYSTFSHLETLWNWILYPCGLMVLMFGVQMLVNATAEIDGEFVGVGTGLRRQGSEGSSSSTEMRNPLVPITRDESGHEHTVV